MEARIAQNIVLVGFMGAGKTSLAAALAKSIGAGWLDTDAEIEAREGEAISDIFARRGEAAFRDLETQLLQELSTAEGRIISTGGGVVVRPENRALLRKTGLVVWLHASESVLFQRVSRNSRRPLLQTPDPRATLRNLLAERLPFYQEVSQVVLDSGRVTRKRMVKTVLEAAGWHPQLT